MISLFEDVYLKKRRRMVDQQIRSRGLNDPRLIDAFLTIPRHLFVNSRDLNFAYNDYPLGIGENQTISQPYIVALMTDALNINDDDFVLEIGTGSGYQTAILAYLAHKVYTLEIHDKLQDKAKKVLTELGFSNIEYVLGNGFKGLIDFAPYDKIIVTASPDHIPHALLSQLKDRGKMVIPVGPRYMQQLILIEKNNEKIKQTSLCDVRFVEMIEQEE
jgi:protein-L-isoaspartate(D-aspartate) O-methyltransferase